MAQVTFAADTTPSLVDLDANFTANYSLRELISTPAHGSFSAYTASNVKGSIDGSYNLTWSGGGFTLSGGAMTISGGALTVSGGNITTTSTRSILVTGSGGIGYGTGSGGTVTQITSKSTAVTLNKTSGQIVMHDASLASGATVAFALNNNTIAATDVVVANVAAGATTSGAYIVECGMNTSAGVTAIAVKNNTAGALAEAITINFVVIKAVAS